MDGNLEISLDKLPIKRLESIEENGLERFPPDVGYDEKRLSLIRRIDFAWAVEKDAKKQKTAAKETATQFPWQSLMENLQSAHQELSVINDLIRTVEANDAVTVASMTRPKPLLNEAMSDLAISAATKLQCFRQLGKYFKQSAKALEQQVTREARFYGALIRLQQNWKVKRQRFAVSASGSEGFSVDLFDNLSYDSTVVFRSSLASAVRVDHDSAGMLAVHLPSNSYRSFHFGFLDSHLSSNPTGPSKIKTNLSVDSSEEIKELVNDDECVKESHSVLREAHRSIFYEQVFDLVNREAFNSSAGISVTGIRENYIQLSIGQGPTVVISLVPSQQDYQTVDANAATQNLEPAVLPFDTFDGVKFADPTLEMLKKTSGFPHRVSCEIYLQQIFHEHVFLRAKERPVHAGRAHLPGQSTKEGIGLLGHFCMSLAHRIFSNKVLTELENLVCGVPYLHLTSQPTWHSRTSSWSVSIGLPRTILGSTCQSRTTDMHGMKNVLKTQFRTKVVVNDDSISVEGEGAPNVVGLFKGNSEEICSMNRYNCDLADLPLILLQQVASQIIRWLHDEALNVGIKAKQDFLSLCFELDQGEKLNLVAHVDPEDTQGCISWWLVMEYGFIEEHQHGGEISDSESEARRFLGHLSLDVLYSTVMDLVSLCDGSRTH